MSSEWGQHVTGVDTGGESPSLDLGKNNSKESENAENGRYDCRQVYANFRFEGPPPEDPDEEPPTAPFRCNQWDCYCCGYRMRMNLVEEIKRVTTTRREMSRLLTLTLDPAKAPNSQEEQHRYITERWNALRTAIQQEFGDFSYIWVREEQKNGLPHLHIIVSRYLRQGWISRRWDDLGGGEIVDIRKIDRVEKVAHYVGKYLTKDAMHDLPDGIRRYSSSQDIELAVRSDSDGESEWDLLVDDYTIDSVRDGVDAVSRPVDPIDFVVQREWGGPLPPPDT